MNRKYKFGVSVVIPNYNGYELLKKNLELVVQAVNNPVNNIKEIIVVDDCSRDESVAFIKKNFPQVRIFRNSLNRGFSATVNAGVRYSKCELVALINSDVAVSKNFMASIIPDFENKNIFAVSMHESGTGYGKGEFSEGYIQTPKTPEPTKTTNTFYVSGGSGVFNKKIWMELGGLDEKLLSPFYWEDIDICYRAAKRGYKMLWEPKSLVEHNHQSTISKYSKKYVTRILERNRLLVVWKNITSKNMLKKHVAGLFKRLMMHPGYLVVVIMAFAKINIVLQKRKKEIRESKLSDEAVFANYAK